MACVVLEKLSKVYLANKGGAVHALRRIDLGLADGELLVLLGPSGSGKSTTLRLIAGLEEPTEGHIMIAGVVVNQTPAKDRDVAMVFQSHVLYPHLSAYENMALSLKLRGYSPAEIAKRVMETADLLDVRFCLPRLPKELSGGERQRVAVGRALVRQPKVFLFDEPLANLDSPLRGQIRAQISRLHSRLGATMLYVTHDQEEAMTLADKIAVMKAGEIQQVGAPMEVYDHPANLFVAGFVGSPPMNFLRGTLARQGYTLVFSDTRKSMTAGQEGMKLRAADEATAKLTGYVDQELILGLRPEHIRLQSGQETEMVWSTVELIEPLGSETCVHLVSGAHRFIARVGSSASVRSGEKVAVAFDMRRAHFFDPATERALL